MIILNLSGEDYDWAQVENALDKVWISVSKSLIPEDQRPPFRPSWVRIWMPAMTTRWVKENDVKQIVDFIDRAIKHKEDENYLKWLKEEVLEFANKFPLP
jgi:glycine hydroxymethyltransferase